MNRDIFPAVVISSKMASLSQFHKVTIYLDFVNFVMTFLKCSHSRKQMLLLELMSLQDLWLRDKRFCTVMLRCH